MAAIMGLEDPVVEKLCEQATQEAKSRRNEGLSAEISVEALVQPANYNSPGQVVIAGSKDAVETAIAILKAGGDFAGGKAIPLQVSAPFHCRLMKPARDRMAELFSQAKDSERPKNLACPYVPNRTARLTSEPGLVFELLVEQVDHPVQWKQSVLHLFEAGYTRGVEFGPGNVLQGLVKRIAKGGAITPSFTGVSDVATLKGLEAILKGA